MTQPSWGNAPVGWRVETTPAFEREVRKLDRPVQARIADYLLAVEELTDPRQRGKALIGDHAGQWRYRVGDYRIIVTLEDDAMIVLALQVGHRRSIYRG